MAGEKFIALEQTSQEIKTAVEGISNSLNGGVADKETLDLINANIGNTDDVGGSLNSGTVMAKLNRLVEKLENQFVFDDDFYMECSKNIVSVNKAITSKTHVTIVDITGCGSVTKISAGSKITATIYIDGEILAQEKSGFNTNFGLYGGSDNLPKVVDMFPPTTCKTSTTLNFKKSFKIVVKNPTGATSSNTVNVTYGIGGAAIE